VSSQNFITTLSGSYSTFPQDMMWPNNDIVCCWSRLPF
jgi:hypothetical protein